jgi:NAD(P)-dependent dehydrogenase (short-subunit alcohol dehydrogenase family)
MAEAYDLRDKVVFITGAARGIGWETARQLAARGARPVLVGLEPELLEQRAAELGTAWFEADVTDADAVRAAADGAAERFGGIDVVMANAGIGASTPIATVDPEVFDTVVRVNLGGVFRTLRATLPHVTARRGYVLPVASLAAAVHAPIMGAYAATKAGTEALANAARGEVAHTGTRVGCAYFGFIDTDMVRRGFDSESGRKAAAQMGIFGPNHSVPVAKAAAAVVRGMERRARFVYAPRWVLAMVLGRTIVQPLQDLGLRRQDVGAMLAEAEGEPSPLTTQQPERAPAA